MADEENAPAPETVAEDGTPDAPIVEAEPVEVEDPIDEKAPDVEDASKVPIKEGDDTSVVTAIEVKKSTVGEEAAPEGEIQVADEPRKPTVSVTPSDEREKTFSAKDASKSDKSRKTPRDSKKREVVSLFDSKGSLLQSESYTKQMLEEMKAKRAALLSMIGGLQAKVKAFKEKDNPSDDDKANLYKYHTQLLDKMGEFEKMTLEVERLMGIAEVRSSQIKVEDLQPKAPEKPPLQDPSKAMANIEETLPKVIVCGTDMEDSIPRIIVCEPLSKKHTEPFYDQKKSDKPEGLNKRIPIECEGILKEKLKEAHDAQQKLALENHEVNQMRLKMQQELFAKQEILENMKQQMLAYESENYRIQNENAELQRKLTMSGQGLGEGKICKRELFMKYRGQSPDGTQFSGTDNIQNLENEFINMEGDVQFTCCQMEYMQSENMTQCYSTSPRKPVCKRGLPQKSTQTDEDKERDIYFETDKDPKYSELREQYHRLHGDFKNKVAEIASLRVDLEKTRTELIQITTLHHELEELHKKELDSNNALLAEKDKMLSSKDRIMDLEQSASFAKQMYTASLEELEEMKALVEDQAAQLDMYRNKYMNTFQKAEHLKRENELMEIEYANKIAVEVQKMKLTMQDHLKDVVPLKELLKVTQQKLKETEQMHTIALETIAQLSEKLDETMNEREMMHSQMEKSGTNSEVIENLQRSLEVAEKRMTELENENEQLRDTIIQLEKLQPEQIRLLEEKSHEVQVLLTQLETLREESARQVSRLKDRNGMIRKCLQAQIAEMEAEVAKCRAETCSAINERDEIRSKLELEICLLSENFRESQNRIVQLQHHVSYLNASHPTSFIDLCRELK